MPKPHPNVVPFPSHRIRVSGLSYDEPVPRKKVMFYYPDFGAMGGIERFIRQVCRRLIYRKNFDPIIVCSKNTPFYYQLQNEGFREGINLFGIQTLPMFKRPNLRIFDVMSAVQILRILTKTQPDLIHVHVGQIDNLLFGALGYPVVYSFHGYGSLYSLKQTMNPVKRFVKQCIRKLFKQMVLGIDGLLFVSHAEQQRMLEEGYVPVERAGQVVHNGLPLSRIRQSVAALDYRATRETFDVPADARVVTFINRMDANKNPVAFVKLAEQLGGEMHDVYFLMAGSGPLAEDVKQRIADSDMHERIKYLDYQDDAYRLLAISDLAVHIPNMEGFGLGVLEATALGTPCVAYATGGIPEILALQEAEHLLVPPGDFDALIAKVRRILQLNEIERGILSHRLQAHAETFDLSKTVEQLEGAYANALR